MKVSCKVDIDPITAEIAKSFDYDFDGESVFETPRFSPPKNFNLGLIVGNSGSGKSLMLGEHFGHIEEEPVWAPDRSVASHFGSFDNACEKLFAVGLSSIPALCRPYRVLSNGEKYRADVARVIGSGCVIDEFTSVVNRETAYGISVALNKYVKRTGLTNIVLASCHFDIIDWLQPDWVFNTNAHTFLANEYSLEDFPALGSITIK
jgi:hypothetical protein